MYLALSLYMRATARLNTAYQPHTRPGGGGCRGYKFKGALFKQLECSQIHEKARQNESPNYMQLESRRKEKTFEDNDQKQGSI